MGVLMEERQRVTESSKTIVVIDEDQRLAENLKEVLEFMDAPHVVTAMPDDWRRRLGNRGLEALFVGPDLSDESLDALLCDLEKFDPDVPVVMIQGSE